MGPVVTSDSSLEDHALNSTCHCTLARERVPGDRESQLRFTLNGKTKELINPTAINQMFELDFSSILLSERVFNSYNLILYVLKAIADKSLFQGIGYKTKQVFIRLSYYYYCKKPICMRCTVTQLAHESVGLCPLSWFVHEGI